MICRRVWEICQRLGLHDLTGIGCLRQSRQQGEQDFVIAFFIWGTFGNQLRVSSGRQIQTLLFSWQEKFAFDGDEFCRLTNKRISCKLPDTVNLNRYPTIMFDFFNQQGEIAIPGR